MCRKVVLLLSLVLAATLTQAEGIDLDCPGFSSQLIESLIAEGLLTPGARADQAKTIGLKLCAGAEQSAQQQHEVGKQQALDSWYLNDMGGKPGNKRLKRFKR